MDSVLCNVSTNNDCGAELKSSKLALNQEEDNLIVIPIESSEGEGVHKNYQKRILPPVPTALHHFCLNSRPQREYERDINYTSTSEFTHPRCDQTTLSKSQSYSSDATTSTSCEIWNRLEEMGRSRSICGRFNRREEMARSRVVSGRYLEALNLYEQALREKSQNFGEQHKYLISTLIQTSRVLESLDMNNEACSNMEKAVSILRYNIESSENNDSNENQSTIEDDIFLAKLHVHVGKMYQKQGNPIAAMKNFREALEIQVECQQGRTHEEVGYVLFLMARLHKLKRQYSDAEKCYFESLQIYKRVGTGKNNSMARALERALNNNNKIMSWSLAKEHWSEQGTV